MIVVLPVPPFIPVIAMIATRTLPKMPEIRFHIYDIGIRKSVKCFLRCAEVGDSLIKVLCEMGGVIELRWGSRGVDANLLN